MSYKAYIYRLRTNEDIDDLKQYLSKMEWVMEDGDIYSPAIFEWFYEVKKTIPIKAYRSRKVIFDYQPTDLVAALTVERPEPGYIRVKNMCISDISEPPNKKPLKKYLEWKKNVLWDVAKDRLKELQS